MDKFDDFIKQNTQLNSKQSQCELDQIKLSHKSILGSDFKFWLGGLGLATSLALVFLVATNLQKPDLTTDTIAETYMFDVFLAVDEEINDSELEDYDFL